jgi:hypothetical protein
MFASGRRRGKADDERAAAALGGDLAGELDLGLQDMIRHAGGIYVQRAGRRSQWGQWLRRRSGGAAGRRGGAARELRRGLSGSAVHELDNKRHRCEAHLLAQTLDGSTTTRRRQQRGIEGGGS